jgi:hypothetical protein
MGHSLTGAGAVVVLLLPTALALADDPPRGDPLAQHEKVMREVLESWNDIARALSLIRDAPTAEKQQSVVRKYLITASEVGKQMNTLRPPTKQEDRELCKRVLVRAREVRARLKSESGRVSAIPDLGPEMKPHMDKVILVGRTLDRIIARGESEPPPS